MNGADAARVSVVVPSYDYARFLPGCIENILGQEGVDIDVTIVDDASNDDSVQVAQRLADAHPEVRVIARRENRGHIATFNEALGSATAPFVVKMDPDDLLPPGSLARSAALLTARPEVAFVYGFPMTFSDEPPTSVPSRVRGWRVWSGSRWVEKVAEGGRNVISQPEVMIRRSALEAAGGHDPRVPASSDLHLWLRLAQVGAVGRVDGPVQGFYRLHAGSMQHTIHAGYLPDLRERALAFELFAAESAASGAEGARVLASARRALARHALEIVSRIRDGDLDAGEPLPELLAAAAELDPGIVGGRRWRALSEDGRPPALAVAGRRLSTDLAYRVRWRRWRRTGLWT
jgi:glycosyltransferase involved in cell wall biosynthesis